MFGKKKPNPAVSSVAQQPEQSAGGAIARAIDARVERHMAAMVANWEALDAQEDAEEEAKRKAATDSRTARWKRLEALAPTITDAPLVERQAFMLELYSLMYNVEPSGGAGGAK